MVTLTKNESHVILLRFMMLITKVNVNILRVLSRSHFQTRKGERRQRRGYGIFKGCGAAG